MAVAQFRVVASNLFGPLNLIEVTDLKPKVAHITTVDLGLRYLLLNQLRDLRQAGYEVVGVSAWGTEVPQVEAAGIRHVPVEMTRRAVTPFTDLKALWQLYRLIRRERFTIVHTHNPKPGLLGQLAAKMAGTPIVVHTLHGFYFHDHVPPALRQFYITLEKIAARCSDVILSQNQEDIQTAIREGICRPEKIKYLGNGIDLRRFDRSQLTPHVIIHKREEIGLPPNVPVIGFVGRLVREKGLLELFAAARRVRECVPAVRLLIVGPVDSDKPDALPPDIAHRCQIADICHFVGLRQDMPELYALMDVLVLPSHREGFPRVPMEASAMSVPCVVSDIRGCREVVEHGRNGLRVPVRDAQALAEAIIEMLGNRDRARRMGEEGRRIALERFDEQSVFEKVKAEYARLLNVKGLVVPLTQAVAAPLEAS